MPQIETGSLDGVTTLWSRLPAERSMAALVFRAGRVDETLATAGITHLVEHLTLAEQHPQRYHFNAEVSARFTTFFMESADAQDVGDFIAAVCAGLTADHGDRLEQEKRILRTEAASRGSAGALGLCLGMRYGAQGPGLLGRDELGLHRLLWPEVDAWRRRWFVQGNAVLWVAGTFPNGLRVPLPPGMPPADPAPRSLPADLPAFFVHGQGGIGISTTSPRSLAATVTVDVLQRHLMKVLRHDRGLSYSVQATAQDLHRDLMHAWIAADALPDQVSVTAHTMLAAIEQIASDGCAQEDIDDYARRLEDAYQAPGGPAMALNRHAQNLLEQRPARSPAEVLGLIGELTPGEVSSACRGLVAQAIAVTPTPVPAITGRMHQLAAWSSEVVYGNSVQSRLTGRSLTCGMDGVMLTSGQGNRVTVRFDAAAALVRWNDSKYTLIGNDGFVLQLDPAEWPDGDRLVAWVDARIDPQRKIGIDAPGPQLPRPEAAPGPAVPPLSGHEQPARQNWSPRKVAAALLTALWLVIAVFGLLAIAGGDLSGGAAFMVIGLLGLGVQQWRQRRRGRRPGAGTSG